MKAPVAACPNRRVTSLEHKPCDETTARALGPAAVGRQRRGERVERFFRDIHGIESAGSHALVLGRVRRRAAGDVASVGNDDGSWRYWTVVCADRGAAGPR